MAANDRFERLIEMFSDGADRSVASRVDALMDIERLQDPRVVPFLLDVLTDEREPVEVRLHALRRVRDTSSSNRKGLHEPVATAIVRVVQGQGQPRLRLNAALALAEFTDVGAVPGALGTIALDSEVPLDIRYSAFTSLERAGPTPECVELIQRLLANEPFAASARSLLSLWRIGERP